MRGNQCSLGSRRIQVSRLAAVSFIALTVTAISAMPISADSGHLTPHREISVMTQNLFEGDLTPVFTATSLTDLLVAVGQYWAMVQASDVPDRAAAIAHEIADAKPTLVALQEAAQWSLGPSPDATVVQLDFLQLILDALAADGVHYAPVVVKDNFDGAAPMFDPTSGLVFVRLLDRDVLLARTDLPAANMKLSGLNSGTFSHRFQIFNPIIDPVNPITVPRSWISADVKVRGKTFRFITTHLEAFDFSVQEQQGLELLSGPANTSLPVAMVGDFNSSATGGPDTTPTYPDLIGAGFVDLWSLAHPLELGQTCCQAPDLMNPVSELFERVDLVLARGGFGVASIELVGDQPGDRPPSGLWPSDHAGVVATPRIP